jgi:hypothetical protein
MKTKITLILIMLCMTAMLASQAKSPSFSGEWKFNREKSTSANNQLFLSKLTVQHKSDSLLTTRVYENQYGEQYPFRENLPLNGKECKIVIYDMPRTSKATLSAGDGKLNLESVTTFYGNSGSDNLKAQEIWTTENEGKTLKIAYTLTYSAGTSTGTQYFDRLK